MTPVPAGLRLLALVAIAAVGSAACSREEGLACESPERYASARSTPPLRVPDDLSVPDETDVLRIPDAPAPEEAENDLPCLESPPDFFSGAGSAEG